MDLRKEFELMRKELDLILPDECGNCSSKDDLYIHHIVPISLGGTNKITNLVRLCGHCHGAVHSMKMKGHRDLVKAGMERARDNGTKLGRPKVNEDMIIEAIKLKDMGVSVKDIIRITGISQGSLYRALKNRDYYISKICA